MSEGSNDDRGMDLPGPMATKVRNVPRVTADTWLSLAGMRDLLHHEHRPTVAIGIVGWWVPGVWWAYAVVFRCSPIGCSTPCSTATPSCATSGAGLCPLFLRVHRAGDPAVLHRAAYGRTPFSRQQRAPLAYTRAKNVSDTVPFGTQLDINAMEYEGIRHSLYPAPVQEHPPRVRIGGPALHPAL